MFQSIRTSFVAAVLAALCSLPVLAGTAAAATPGETLFATNCSPCHGPAGRGDGPAAAALNPKPRNFTDKSLMGKLTDQQLMDTVRKGGAAMGKSPIMPAFALSDADILAVINHVRSLGK